jgi:hypothetical protein
MRTPSLDVTAYTTVVAYGRVSVSFCVGCILLDKITSMQCCCFHKDATLSRVYSSAMFFKKILRRFQGSLFWFHVSCPDDMVFRPDAHQSATSIRTTRSFRPDAHQCLEALNSSRLHPSERNGKLSGRSS